MLLHRICRAAYAADAWTGEGAFRHAMRWNHRGVRMVYTSTSLALAAIEYFVNLEPNLSPLDLVACAAELPTGLDMADLSLRLLPDGWNRSRPEALQALGDAWLASRASVSLRVPSAVVEGEWNVLLNPAHVDFVHVNPLPPSPFHFAPRMFAHH